MQYSYLASLLEQAAHALRKAEAELDVIRHNEIERISIAPGIWRRTGLGVRAVKTLRKLGIEYLDECEKLTHNDIADIKGCGKTTYAEIVAKLKEHGIQLKGIPIEDSN